MSKKANNLYIATTIKNTKFQEKNVVYDCYEKKINLENYLEKIYSYGCKKLTIQTGASLNEQLLRKNLIDYISIVVAPCLVG